MSDTLYFTTHDSAIGKLLLVAGSRGLRYLTLLEGEDAKTHLARKFSTPPVPTIMSVDGFFTSATRAIDSYLAGEARELKLPYDLAGGTALQRAVWLAIARVPYGQTISYTTLAEKVGFPRAVRAVASACGANPVPLAVPCHRIIAKDGGLGGFSLGGVGVKEQLLTLEGKSFEESVAA